MTVALLDVNVLVALSSQDHMHHAQAMKWYTEHAKFGWATCVITELGFVRIICQPVVLQRRISPQGAVGSIGPQLRRPAPPTLAAG